MKLIHQETNVIHGYWSNDTTYRKYYLCETEEEYNEMKNKYGDEYPISVTPHVSVSDGYATYGGKSFNAVGVEDYTRVGNECTAKYYIKPNSITNEKHEPVKGWWV